MSLGDPAVSDPPPSPESGTSAESGSGTATVRASDRFAARPVWADPILIGAIVLWVGTLGILRMFDHAHTLPTLPIVAAGAVAMPGAPVELVAHVERHLPDGTIEREGIEVDLRLALEEPTAGLVRTDADGVARRTVTAPMDPGSTPIAVVGVGAHSKESKLLYDPNLTVVPAGTPWVLCEIDTVVGPDPNARAHRGEEPPLVASRAAGLAISELSASRTFIYLHLGEGAETDALRHALRLGVAPRRTAEGRVIPHGALLSARRPGEGIDAYRARMVDEWTASIGPPAVVVTRSPNGCFVYRGADLPTIVLEGAPCDGALAADSWAAAKKLIAELVPGP